MFSCKGIIGGFRVCWISIGYRDGVWVVCERGSWFDKLTMRESVDATLIAKIADQKGCKSQKVQNLAPPVTHPSPVILGLDPRTHNIKEPNIWICLISLTVGPRVKPEDDGEEWVAGELSSAPFVIPHHRATTHQAYSAH
ncbi:hypothetical protein SAMN05443582_1011149 [Phyllobacterium sp. OV277]|nr:hypothetical protein SAMN05443582_1011149 [Phyllobacterium sp. OV277]